MDNSVEAYSLYQDPDIQTLWLNSFSTQEAINIGSDSKYPIILIPDISRKHGIKLKILRSTTNQHTPGYEWPIQFQSIEELHDLLMDSSRLYDWDIIILDLIPLNSTTYQNFKLLKTLGWKVEFTEWQSSAVIDFSISSDKYNQNLSSKLRTNIKRQTKNLNDSGELVFKDVGNDSDWKEWLHVVLMLELNGWKGKKGTAILQNDNEYKFYVNLLEYIQKKNRLRLYILTLDNVLLAANIMHYTDHASIGVKTIYNEEFSKYSPGSILQKMIIDHLFDEGSKTKLDMLYPVTKWKQQWSTHIEPRFRIVVYRNKTKPYLVYFSRQIAKHMIRIMKKDAETSSLEQ